MSISPDIVSSVIFTFDNVLSAPLIIVLTELKLFEASISESYIVAIDVLKRLPTLSTEPVILVVNILSSELMLV